MTNQGTDDESDPKVLSWLREDTDVSGYNSEG